MINVLLAALFGVLEGVTEWLPVSSTGHLILLRHFLRFPVRDTFFSLFEVVIQLAAIGAVVVCFFEKLNPFAAKKSKREKRATWRLYLMVMLATLPALVVGLFLDEWLDTHLYRYEVVAATLIFYGVLFIVIERVRCKKPRVADVAEIEPRHALSVGAAQVLSLVPGTSRSGATILGGMLSGLSRSVAAEFSFFLAIPVMCGASLLKTAKFFFAGYVLTGEEWCMLAAGSLAAFLCSLLAIRALVRFVGRHTLSAFGVYRILLGVAVLIIK